MEASETQREKRYGRKRTNVRYGKGGMHPEDGARGDRLPQGHDLLDVLVQASATVLVSHAVKVRWGQALEMGCCE